MDAIAGALAHVAAHVAAMQPAEDITQAISLATLSRLKCVKCRFHPRLTLLDYIAPRRTNDLVGVSTALSALAPDANRADLQTAIGTGGIVGEWHLAHVTFMQRQMPDIAGPARGRKAHRQQRLAHGPTHAQALRQAGLDALRSVFHLRSRE